MRSTIGDRSVERKMDGNSPPVTPPGTDATAGAATTTGSADAMAAPGTDVAVATWPTPASVSGEASGISRAGSVGPPGVDTHRHGGVRQGLGQEVRRVGPQPVRRRGRPQLTLGRGQGHAGPGRDDLAPAEPVGVGRVREGDRGPGSQRRIQRRAEAAHDPHRVQPADAGREGQPGLVEDERLPRPVDAQRQARLEGSAGGRAPGVGLGVGDLAVAIGVEAEARLERRDLGLVDDDVEQDPIGLDADPGVVVDGEVAERMRGDEGGDGRARRRRR